MLQLVPDIAFKKKLENLSGASLSSCMQCGTCSVVCNLSPDVKPFPRQQMTYAGWGMKEGLLYNPDLWLCHQCGDCSTHCPRGVNPADVLSATRQVAYKTYARPAFLGALLTRPALLPLAILLPVIIISCILIAAGTFSIPEGPVDYSAFFPHIWLNISFTALTLLSYSLALSGLFRFWKDMKKENFGNTPGDVSFFKSIWKSLGDVLAHSRFNKCEKNSGRKISHFLVFYGFALLLLVTLYAIIASITHHYPLSFLNPFKILGNLASLMLLSGLAIMIYNRLAKKEGSEKSTYNDWLLLISLLLLTISGSVVETARFLDWNIAYHLYFFHLVCVWFVIIYLPFTKFGHLVYRFLAMTYAFSINRN